MLSGRPENVDPNPNTSGVRSIAFFLHSMSRGGAERVVATLANYWAAQGKTVTVITIAPLVRDFYTLDRSVLRLSLCDRSGERPSIARILGGLSRAWRLRKILRRIGPDAAISMMDTANVTLAIAGIAGGRSKLIGSERIFPPAVALPWVWVLLRYWSYRFLSTVVVQSADTAAWVSAHTRARNSVVIPNPVRLPLPIEDPFVLPPAESSVEGGMILAAGRLERQKGFDLLLDAFSDIASAHPNWSLCILGEGPQRVALEDQVRVLGLCTRVRLVGAVGNMGDWYSAADLFVLSSRFEGFPNALLEAMAHGVPSVSFDCKTGPRDILRTGVDGLLVAPEDPIALGMAMKEMIDRPSFRRACSVRASEVVDRFSVEKVAQMWESVAGSND